MSSIAPTRMRARVEGIVQGVGVRPFVHRLAREQGLSGWVRNDARGVLLEVEGEAREVERFLGRLAQEPPALAMIERVRIRVGGIELIPPARSARAARATRSPAPPGCAGCSANG